jgi:hypothetical protein
LPDGEPWQAPALQPFFVSAISVSFLKLTGAGSSMLLTEQLTAAVRAPIVATICVSPLAKGSTVEPSIFAAAAFVTLNDAAAVRSRTSLLGYCPVTSNCWRERTPSSVNAPGSKVMAVG